MNPFLHDPDFTLYVGDALTVLSELPDESVHCVVTSPPYFGLRDYGTGVWTGGDESCDHVDKSKVLGNVRRNLAEAANRSDGGQRVAENRRDHDGDQYGTFRDVCGKCGAVRVDHQLGLEATPFDFVDRMVVIFREVRRVLRSDGVCWLNLGDSYATSGTRGYNGGGELAHMTVPQNSGYRRRPEGLKEKDLIGVPWRVALALQDDGWWLRSDCIWSKPSTMPESVTDRPTRSHEYLFLLTKSARYFYDQEPIREAPSTVPQRRLTATADQPKGAARSAAGIANPAVQGGPGLAVPPQPETLTGEPPPPPKPKSISVVEKQGGTKFADDGKPVSAKREYTEIKGANKRTVWEVSIQPFKDAHFAVFPEKLIEPCVLAGTSEHGCCPECGAPWERVTEGGEGTYEDRKALGFGGAQNMKYGEHPGNHRQARPSHIELTPAAKTTVGWRPTCSCTTPEKLVEPCIEAGTSEHGCCPACGAPWERVTEKVATGRVRDRATGGLGTDVRREPQGLAAVDGAFQEGITHRTVGWDPTCECGKASSWPTPVPCTVLDPFMGSGTTALVSRRLGRKSIGIELNPTYAEMAAKRLSQQSLFA